MVNTTIAGSWSPSAATLADGRTVIAWKLYDPDDPATARLRAIRAASWTLTAILSATTCQQTPRGKTFRPDPVIQSLAGRPLLHDVGIV